MSIKRDIIHFGAGPAGIPEEVLAEVSAAVEDYRQSGLSVLELPHRSHDLFQDILTESKKLVYELCGLDPELYEVLWMQGGGRLQFAMIPMNFLASDVKAAYIDSGYWASDAIKNAAFYGGVDVVASSRGQGYSFYPLPEDPVSGAYSYLHLTTNNTIYGTQLSGLPESAAPLIADMSSDIFSVPREYGAFDMFYAVAQKNLGAAGNTLVVVKKSLLQNIVRLLPPVLDYASHARAGSVLNTPPVFGIYLSLQMLRYIRDRGLDGIYRENEKKATLLYRELERNSLFVADVHPEHRSKANIVFRMRDEKHSPDFLAFAENAGLFGIEGHRSLGGFRVSLYNAVREEHVERLVEAMQSFERKINHNL